ncbi:MAG: glycosyltransferase [Bifidobacterium sp.]|jgi:GT2 family glycosyltransferase|nr:glycosyltransferase [Bifidobacterium sp.]
MNLNVTAVVVSYNRAGLLRECLDGLAGQTRRPNRVIVIDNASTDDAVEVARHHPLQPEVTVLKRNVGGAGGFCAGIAQALDASPQDPSDPSGQATRYIWLMDDDTIPTPMALEALLAAAREARALNGVWPATLGSRALWIDGREHLMNKPRPRAWRALGARELRQSDGAFQIRSLSFVSCLINARMIESARALPCAAYFLWNDDYEYTTKLLKDATGYYVPASRVVHKTKIFGSSDADPGARFFFEVRNKLWIARFSRRNFSGIEYAELVLKSLRRWALTFWRSTNRPLLVDCLKRGLQEGVNEQPASNAAILGGNPDIVAKIEAVESRAAGGSEV